MLRLSQAAWLLCFPLTLELHSHTLSMSTSRLDVSSDHATLELIVPAYEAQHVAQPRTVLAQAIEIDGSGPATSNCSEENRGFICRSTYRVSGDAPLRIRCLLAKVIVENHVHVMHAARGGRVDQAVFDRGMEQTVLRFRRQGALESAISARPQMMAILLLAALAVGLLGADIRRSLISAGAFAAGALCASLFRSFSWQLTPGFLEVGVAVTAAYAAFEVLFFPPGVSRAIVAGVAGLFFGTYLLVLSAAGSILVLPVCAALVALAIAWILRRAGNWRPAIAITLMVASVGWILLSVTR
jgi:hypothetical protein